MGVESEPGELDTELQGPEGQVKELNFTQEPQEATYRPPGAGAVRIRFAFRSFSLANV